MTLRWNGTTPVCNCLGGYGSSRLIRCSRHSYPLGPSIHRWCVTTSAAPIARPTRGRPRRACPRVRAEHDRGHSLACTVSRFRSHLGTAAALSSSLHRLKRKASRRRTARELAMRETGQKKMRDVGGNLQGRRRGRLIGRPQTRSSSRQAPGRRQHQHSTRHSTSAAIFLACLCAPILLLFKVNRSVDTTQAAAIYTGESEALCVHDYILRKRTRKRRAIYTQENRTGGETVRGQHDRTASMHPYVRLFCRFRLA